MAANTFFADSGSSLRIDSDSGAKSAMRTTVPFLCGSWLRGPPVGSAALLAICAGVACVLQTSTDQCPGRRGLVWTAGAGPSDITAALPLRSCPVTTRLTRPSIDFSP